MAEQALIVAENPATEDRSILEAAERESQALGVIRNYMFGNAAVGLMPLPLVDLVAFSGVQLKMVHSLSQIYGVPFRQDLGKSVITSLLGSLGTLVIAGGIFGSMMKFLPGVGSLVAGVTLPAVSAAVTYAIGKVFIMHFEAGGTLLDFDSVKFRDYFDNFYKEGLNISPSETTKV